MIDGPWIIKQLAVASCILASTPKSTGNGILFSVKNNKLSFSFSRLSIALILSNKGINGLIPKAFLVSVSIILL